MSDSDDSGVNLCGVCAEHGRHAAAEAQGLVCTGIEAVFAADQETIRNVFNTMTPFDGHIAIGLLALLLADIEAMIPSFSADRFLAMNRAAINAELAKPA